MVLPEMIFVEGGTFLMGGCFFDECTYYCENQDHIEFQVTLNSFYIAKFEVTQLLWEAFMPKFQSFPTFTGSNLPVFAVTWYQAQEFIEKLNRFTGKNYRLLTEAEWEYAARGGNQSMGYKYSGSNNADGVAWTRDNTTSIQPVGTKKPNELSIYDMSGNVAEWCNDWEAPYTTSPRINPQGPETGVHKLYRGGSWAGLEEYGVHYVSYRCAWNPAGTLSAIGFRLAHSVEKH
jgi:formylglycine-generating enzyme required for sulfatase activity